MGPDFRRLVKVVAKHTDDYIAAKVNCDEEDALCNRFNIGGFPTLMWFDGGVDKHEQYRGGRDFDSMFRFVKDKSGLKADIPQLKTFSKDVNGVELDKLLAQGKNVFTMFYAPCIRFILVLTFVR